MRPFLTGVVCSWIALFIAAKVSLGQHPHLYWIMTAALPAFLLEAFFYLGSIFEPTRIRLKLLGSPAAQAGVLWLSAISPYLLFTLLAETFQLHAFAWLVGLTAALAFWHVLMPRRLMFDLAFLALAATPILLRTFAWIYLSPNEHFRVDILGHLMWIRLGIAALLLLREWHPGCFSLWPVLREWKLGALCYFVILAPITMLALGLHDVRFEPADGPWWRVLGIALGTFFAFLWVIALGEELFFRGVVQRALSENWRSPGLAIFVSAILFGSVHLWFHHFPNWRRALVAMLLGVACGIGYARSGSVRTPMVTHALVVTTWRVFFQ
jgi:uncharacterized protein